MGRMVWAFAQGSFFFLFGGRKGFICAIVLEGKGDVLLLLLYVCMGGVWEDFFITLEFFCGVGDGLGGAGWYMAF